MSITNLPNSVSDISVTNTLPEDMRERVNHLVNDAYALGRGQTDRLKSDYTSPDKSIAERIMALLQEVDRKAREEKEIRHRFCSKCYKLCSHSEGWYGKCPTHGCLGDEDTIYCTLSYLERLVKFQSPSRENKSE